MIKLALGPVLFEWGRSGLREFYRRVAAAGVVDIFYLGEVVCSKRARLTVEELVELATELSATGKEVVFSSLGLVMDDAELEEQRRLVAAARAGGWKVEANDVAALGMAEGMPLVAGPHINTYNAETVNFLKGVGVRRLVFPVELARDAMVGIMAKTRGLEIELFAHGKLPLTFSARCYTARAFRLSKANCQYKCGDFPDGMTIATQERENFLTINGTQTMSDRVFTLVDAVGEIARLGVEVVRVSPQSRGMVELLRLWRQALDGEVDGAAARVRLAELTPDTSYCNGYFYGRPGLDLVEPGLAQQRILAGEL